MFVISLSKPSQLVLLKLNLDQFNTSEKECFIDSKCIQIFKDYLLYFFYANIKLSNQICFLLLDLDHLTLRSLMCIQLYSRCLWLLSINRNDHQVGLGSHTIVNKSPSNTRHLYNSYATSAQRLWRLICAIFLQYNIWLSRMTISTNQPPKVNDLINMHVKKWTTVANI